MRPTLDLSHVETGQDSAVLQLTVPGDMSLLVRIASVPSPLPSETILRCVPQGEPKLTEGGFRGEYAFCSNFYASPLVYQGKVYRCGEGAYQAAKFADPAFQAQFTKLNGAESKHLGKTRNAAIRPDWNEARVGVMREVLAEKFRDPDLRKRLLATGETQLVEFNTWGDRFWGICRDQGGNWLGRLLMELRDEMKRNGGHS